MSETDVPDDFPGGGFDDFIWIRLSTNEVGHRESGALNLVADAELIELGAMYQDATSATIVLELGDSGGAVFAKAFAAWGITP